MNQGISDPFHNFKRVYCFHRERNTSDPMQFGSYESQDCGVAVTLRNELQTQFGGSVYKNTAAVC